MGMCFGNVRCCLIHLRRSRPKKKKKSVEKANEKSENWKKKKREKREEREEREEREKREKSSYTCSVNCAQASTYHLSAPSGVRPKRIR